MHELEESKGSSDMHEWRIMGACVARELLCKAAAGNGEGEVEDGGSGLLKRKGEAHEKERDEWST